MKRFVLDIPYHDTSVIKKFENKSEFAQNICQLYVCWQIHWMLKNYPLSRRSNNAIDQKEKVYLFFRIIKQIPFNKLTND